MKILLLSLVVTLAFPFCIHAQSFHVDLPSLTGPYSSGWRTYDHTAFLQLPAAPKNVVQVRLELLGYYDSGLIAPFDNLTQSHQFDLTLLSILTPACTSVTNFSRSGVFAVSQTFACGPFDFLSDANDDITLTISPVPIPSCWEILQFPSLYVGSAEIYVDESPYLVRPAENEFLHAGTTYNLTWLDARTQPQSYLLSYSINNGQTWTAINDQPLTQKSYTWLVPQLSSSSCLLRLTDANNPQVYGQTPLFYIYQCSQNIEADLNHDCYTNFADMAILASNWLSTCSADSWCNGADFDSSHEVDFKDLYVVTIEWLRCSNDYDILCNPSASERTLFESAKPVNLPTRSLSSPSCALQAP